MQEIECSVSGRVQFVMFRDYAQRKAKKLGLVGCVRNIKDGSVYVLAQGEQEALNKYIDLLKKGSLLSRVDSVKVLWREPSFNFNSFSIVY
jgi:acylphosphatase